MTMKLKATFEMDDLGHQIAQGNGDKRAIFLRHFMDAIYDMWYDEEADVIHNELSEIVNNLGPKSRERWSKFGQLCNATKTNSTTQT